MSSSSSSSPEDLEVPLAAVVPPPASVAGPPAVAPLLSGATVQQLATAVADLIQSRVATGNPLMSGPATTTVASHPPRPEVATVLDSSSSSTTTPSSSGPSSSGKIYLGVILVVCVFLTSRFLSRHIGVAAGERRRPHLHILAMPRKEAAPISVSSATRGEGTDDGHGQHPSQQKSAAAREEKECMPRRATPSPTEVISVTGEERI